MTLQAPDQLLCHRPSLHQLLHCCYMLVTADVLLTVHCCCRPQEDSPYLLLEEAMITVASSDEKH